MGRLWRTPLATVGLAAGLGLASLGVSQSQEGMGKPNLEAHWGSSSEKAQRPVAPNRRDVPWFQTLVDEAPPGSVLKPPPGVYAGPVLVNKPLTSGVILQSAKVI